MTTAVIRYLFLLILNIMVNIIGLIFNPIVVLFTDEFGCLPTWLWWFQTPDNSLNGDNGWKTEHVLWLRNGSYLKRVLWLYRNNVHGFSTNVLGFTVKEGYDYRRLGYEKISNRPLYEGRIIRKVVNGDGKTYFQWYYVKAWSKTRCIRINIGWKIWENPFTDKKCQYVFSPSLFMGYSR